jgi:hypothetical protein
MAELYRRLYDAAAYAQGLEPILRELLQEAFRGLPVNVSLDVDSSKLSVGDMTAIALLVNEAAINAAKHVFRPEKGGLFEASLAEARSGRLAKQLGGELEVLDGPGATLKVEFLRDDGRNGATSPPPVVVPL